MRRGRLTAMYTKNQDDENSGAFKPGRVLITSLYKGGGSSFSCSIEVMLHLPFFAVSSVTRHANTFDLWI